MMSDKFFCNACEKTFDMPEFYYEKHGLLYPPYERVAICPFCSGDDFIKFDSKVEKTDVAVNVLNAILMLNRFTEKLEHILCAKFKNSDLYNAVELLSEFVVEMFDFADSDIQKQILNLNCDKKLKYIFMKLTGE